MGAVKNCCILKHSVKRKEEQVVYLLVSYYLLTLTGQHNIHGVLTHQKWMLETSREPLEKRELS